MVACARPDPGREDDLVGQPVGEDPSLIATNEEEEGNDTTPQQTTDWPTAEGYTPLGDVLNFGGGNVMMFAMPPPVEDDNNVGSNSNEFFYSTGPNNNTFVADPSELFRTLSSESNEDHSNGNPEENGEEEGLPTSHLPENNANTDDGGGYRDVASIALLALEEDYQMTVRGHVQPSLLDEPSSRSAPPAMPMLDADAFAAQPPANPAEKIEDFADFSNVTGHDEQQQQSQQAALQNYSDNTTNNGIGGNQSTGKELPSIDTEAVKKAVAGIIHNTSDKFSDKLKKWQQDHENTMLHGRSQQQQQQQQQHQHNVIFSTQLRAFYKDTPKAIQATANLTRSATIAEALHRFSALLQSQDCLSIHIVGADHVECSSEDRIRTHFAPLARWINANIYSPRHLSLSLVGPNVPTAMTNNRGQTPTNLLPPTTQQQQIHQRLQSATAQCYEASYHDWLEEQVQLDANDGRKGKNLPDLVVCFNAGIWGYDEWKPTLQSLINLKRKIPFLVTSYTLEEAEDDFDVIDEVYKEASVAGAEESNKAATSTAEMPTTSLKRQGCLWEPEANFFGSKHIRETVTAVKGREYRENSAWQAWRF